MVRLRKVVGRRGLLCAGRVQTLGLLSRAGKGKQEMGGGQGRERDSWMREGVIWGQHSSEMNQGGDLVWEAGTPLVHCPCDITDELFFLCGPQFLHVSSSVGERDWPGRSLGPLALVQQLAGEGGVNSSLCFCPIAWRLAALSSGSGRRCSGLIQPEIELP